MIASTARKTTHWKTLASAGLLTGVALFTALIVYQGVGDVAAALAVAGSGLLIVTLFHLVPLGASAIGWYYVLRPIAKVRLPPLTRARWIAESINQLLPVLQIGGNVVRARLIVDRNLPGTVAGASVVVDITLHFLAQIIFTSIGLTLLLTRLGTGELIARVLLGVTLMAGAVFGFYFVQRRGLFRFFTLMLDRIAHTPEWGSLASSAAATDAAIHRFYCERRSLSISICWHLASWMLGTGEAWLALYFLGHPVSLQGALLLESLGEAIRTAAFAVPGGLGVQEGGYMVLGSFLGLPPEVALSASLAKRVRELLLGVPGLVVWQVQTATAALSPTSAHGKEQQ